MPRTYPNARRATLPILATRFLLLLALASALLVHPSSARADGQGSTSPVVSSRRPMPGDPNTPDEGRSGTTTTRVAATAPAGSFLAWLKGLVHFRFQSR